MELNERLISQQHLAIQQKSIATIASKKTRHLDKVGGGWKCCNRSAACCILVNWTT